MDMGFANLLGGLRRKLASILEDQVWVNMHLRRSRRELVLNKLYRHREGQV